MTTTLVGKLSMINSIFLLIIFGIFQNTNNNEHLVCSVKKGIIYALYNFCIADNQGVPLLTKASPSKKGYTTFVLLSEPHRGVYTNFKF